MWWEGTRNRQGLAATTAEAHIESEASPAVPHHTYAIAQMCVCAGPLDRKSSRLRITAMRERFSRMIRLTSFRGARKRGQRRLVGGVQLGLEGSGPIRMRIGSLVLSITRSARHACRATSHRSMALMPLHCLGVQLSRAVLVGTRAAPRQMQGLGSACLLAVIPCNSLPLEPPRRRRRCVASSPRFCPPFPTRP